MLNQISSDFLEFVSIVILVFYVITIFVLTMRENDNERLISPTWGKGIFVTIFGLLIKIWSSSFPEGGGVNEYTLASFIL
jgi:heme/copper-type cytochrome/quinol oxidase subunit 2